MKRTIVVICLVSLAFLIATAFLVTSFVVVNRNWQTTRYNITPQKATAYTTAFRSQQEAQGRKRGEYVEAFYIPGTELQDLGSELKTVSKGNMANIGMRIYMGINDRQQQTLVVVATDSLGKNITFYKDEVQQLHPGIFSYTQPCPPQCDPNPFPETSVSKK